MHRSTSKDFVFALSAVTLFTLASPMSSAQTWSLSIHDEVHDLSAENCNPNPCPTESRSRTRSDAYTLPAGPRHHLKIARSALTDNRANAGNVACFGAQGQWCFDSSSSSGFAEIDSRRIDVRHGRTSPGVTELRADAPPETGASALVDT